MIMIVFLALRSEWPDRLRVFSSDIPKEVIYSDECVSKETAFPVSQVPERLSLMEGLNDDIWRTEH